jgi:hypothetical protein
MSKTNASRKPLTAMLTRGWEGGGQGFPESLVVVCDDGAVFSYSWSDGAWGELAAVPGTRREPVKAREDVKEQARQLKELNQGLETWKKRTDARRAAAASESE